MGDEKEKPDDKTDAQIKAYMAMKAAEGSALIKGEKIAPEAQAYHAAKGTSPEELLEASIAKIRHRTSGGAEINALIKDLVDSDQPEGVIKKQQKEFSTLVNETIPQLLADLAGDDANKHDKAEQDLKKVVKESIKFL